MRSRAGPFNEPFGSSGTPARPRVATPWSPDSCVAWSRFLRRRAHSQRAGRTSCGTGHEDNADRHERALAMTLDGWTGGPDAGQAARRCRGAVRRGSAPPRHGSRRAGAGGHRRARCSPGRARCPTALPRRGLRLALQLLHGSAPACRARCVQPHRSGPRESSGSCHPRPAGRRDLEPQHGAAARSASTARQLRVARADGEGEEQAGRRGARRTAGPAARRGGLGAQASCPGAARQRCHHRCHLGHRNPRCLPPPRRPPGRPSRTSQPRLRRRRSAQPPLAGSPIILRPRPVPLTLPQLPRETLEPCPRTRVRRRRPADPRSGQW